MEISAKKDSDRARRARWLFVAALLGAVIGAGTGLMWRSWLSMPADPGFAAEFLCRLAGYLFLKAIGFWDFFPNSAGTAWAQRVDAALGPAGVARQIEHLRMIGWCAAGGALASVATLAAISGAPNLSKEGEPK